jgi:hypothetical protein
MKTRDALGPTDEFDVVREALNAAAAGIRSA